jgi:hypothetical protein
MKATLAELEQVAKAIDVKVTYDDLKTSKGGACRVQETRRIMINKHLQSSEKITLLARELSRFDLAGIEVPDHVRKKIQRESDQRTGLQLTA